MQGVGVGGVGVGASANLNAETDTRDLNTFELAAELDSSGDPKGESQQQNLRTYVRTQRYVSPRLATRAHRPYWNDVRTYLIIHNPVGDSKKPGGRASCPVKHG